LISVEGLEFKFLEYRKLILQMIRNAIAGLIDGSHSCVVVSHVLFNQAMDILPFRVISFDGN